ncbi:sensor histidine kinase [Lewinella sp. JB7]|uniref:sensor histidine kinase n=1 Tax=Lewinella sp. JB7 TaxID=2962887 RepID=UPI0020C974EA|nr:histidine kinase [Lewinella sp. JB7]MCP9234567.1 histidine kinase [Lewinella sp. JB7]
MERLKFSRIAVQALAWVGLWVIVFSVLGGGGFDTSFRFFRRLGPLLIAIAALVIVNGAVLLPRLYFTGRRGWYVVAGIAVLLAATFLLQYGSVPDRSFPLNLGRGARPRGLGMATLRFFLPLATAFLGSTLIEVMRYAGYREKQAVQAQREQLATELKFLKSQVNPHFLFNSLNNIYTLTLLHDEKAPESLLRLSGMLRYMLYDSETEVVPLGREIEYIRNYIALLQLKDSRGLNVTAELDDSRPDLPIAPLLLIPFVENAFKHSRIEDLDRGFIHITLTTRARGIAFTVTNSLPAVQSSSGDRVGGIGLDNVRKRLELLYPDRHQLSVEPQAEQFRITLSLELT